MGEAERLVVREWPHEAGGGKAAVGGEPGAASVRGRLGEGAEAEPFAAHPGRAASPRSSPSWIAGSAVGSGVAVADDPLEEPSEAVRVAGEPRGVGTERAVDACDQDGVREG